MRPLLFALLFAGCLHSTHAIGAAAGNTEFIGFSLPRAAASARRDGNRLPVLTTLGMTDVIGFVVDPGVEDDLVVLGRRRKDGTVLGPDAVAQLLRTAAMGGLTGPGVSLEPIPGDTNALEAVYFGGSGTTFMGNVAFFGDLLFKEMALGFKPSGIGGMKSYADRMLEEMGSRHVTQWDVLSRFWFAPSYMPVAHSQNCWVLTDPKLTVLVENLRASIDGITQTNHIDAAAESFSGEAAQRFEELAARNPEFADVRAMMGSLQVAALMIRAAPPHHLDYWLSGYAAMRVECPKGTNFLRRSVSGTGISLTVFGGVRAAGLALRLEHRELSAIKEAILAARPGDRSIPAWTLSLDADGIPASGNLSPTQLRAARRFVQGLRLREARRFREAATAFDEAAAVAPESVECAFLACLCRREARIAAAAVNELGASLAEFRHLARENPGFLEARYELATTLSALGSNAEALGILEGLVREAPDYVVALYAAALCQYRLGRPQLAEAALRKCLELAPGGPVLRDSRQLLKRLKSERPRAGSSLYECGQFACRHPASWKVLTKDAAARLLPDAIPSSSIEVAFVHPANPDCNIVITTRPIPNVPLTPSAIQVALTKAERALQSKNSGFRKLGAQVIRNHEADGFFIAFVTDRFGRPFQQHVTTLARPGHVLTITCSAPAEQFDAMWNEAFALTEDIQLEPLPAR